MLKFSRLLFLLVLFPMLVPAQSRTALVFPLSADQLKIKKSVRKFSTAQGYPPDSILNIINGRLLKNITAINPDFNIVFASPATVRAVFDSSGFHYDDTTPFRLKMKKSKGFNKMLLKCQSSEKSKYLSRRLSVPGTLALQQEVLNSNTTFYLFINRVKISDDNSHGFTMDYEIFARDSGLFYGNNYKHSLDTESDMYISTFIYYLNYAVDNFPAAVLNEIQDMKKGSTTK